MIACIRVAAALLPIAALAGCGGANFGADLAQRPRAAPLKTGDGATLRIPADEKFAIALAPSSREPGLGGAAEADSKVGAEGSAMAMASVRNNGKASAGFQLGHAFSNTGDRQADATITLKYHYVLRAEAQPPSNSPGATVGLKLYARNGNNVLVRTVDLLGHSTENGAALRQGASEYQFTLTLGPGETMNVYIAGQAAVDIKPEHDASGELRLSDVQLEITSKLAPPVRVGGNDQ